MEQVLLLNASFEPLVIVSWQKGIQLLFQGKVEVVEESDREIRTVRMQIRMPSVLRLLKFIPIVRKRGLIRFSRANVFLRDNYTCQYCGRKRNRSELTLDHVEPVSRGGDKNWKNIVTACMPCNQRKGGRTPVEASMRLLRSPTQPDFLPTYSLRTSIQSTPEPWRLYLAWQV